MTFLSNVAIRTRKVINFIFEIYIYLVIIVVFAITAYPFWYILVYSLSNPAKLVSGFLVFPTGITLESFIAVFNSPSVVKSFFISIARSSIGPILSTIVSLFVAYSLTRKDLPGRKFFTWYFVLTMYFGAGLIPTYLLIKSLNLTGSFWVYILPSLMNVYGMILMRTYIETLPVAMEESAYIDGANEFVIFYKIIAPLSTPVIAAIILLSCVNHWNSYTDTLIYNSSSPNLYTLQYVLVQLVTTISAGQSEHAIKEMMANPDRVSLTPMVVRMAITIVTVIPISLVYPFLQKYFMKGIMIGAVKG
jgi:putative aldouronate transport system permease protein